MKKILIANRSEIVLRVIRTCKRLGFETVAVYSESDKDHPHVSQADSAFSLGHGSVLDTYLNIEKIVAILRNSNADALHPGYGFLSENPDFAKAVADQGVTFIGPSTQTLRLLGLKHSARQAADRAGIPVIPGYDGEIQELSAIEDEIMQIGFPLLVKASAGGGGKGIRRVENKAQLEDAFAATKREGMAFFGDTRVIVERAFTTVRHVEVQVIGDIFGNVIHLYERDCSLQRRNQKIIEEAPAACLSETLRQKLFSAAIALAKEVKLVGAATVEFLVPCGQRDGGAEEFYFLEANPRIQVEHPVSEAVTGLDIVELQILVARGNALPITQEQVLRRGHALEARICAEIPEKDFLPNAGRIHLVDFAEAAALDGVRTEHALCSGLEVTTDYDSMLAKVIAWGETREQARTKLCLALAGVRLSGVSTNIRFLVNLLNQPEFITGKVATNFIETYRSELLSLPDEISGFLKQVVACFLYFPVLERTLLWCRIAQGACFDPFEHSVYWRNSSIEQSLTLSDPFRSYEITCPTLTKSVVIIAKTLCYQAPEKGEALGIMTIGFGDTADSQCEGRIRDVGHMSIKYLGEHGSGAHSKDDTSVIAPILEINDHIVKPVFYKPGTSYRNGSSHISLGGFEFIVSEFRESMNPVAGVENQSCENITSPLPGTILSALVTDGSRVEAGDALIILESMKMEHRILAPRSSKVTSVLVAPGKKVQSGQVLVVLE